MRSSNLSTHVLTALFAVLLTASALADPTPNPAPPAANADQTVQLSPFEVSANSAPGYATTSSTSASRIAVPITDIPSSVVVLDKKLIDDLVSVNASDVLNLVGGVSAYAETQSQQMNKFFMRGYTSSTAERDGFVDLLYGVSGGFNYTFIDHMEILKGPNGILYGNNNMGGLLNLISKKPLAEPTTDFQLMAGSYGFYQASIDTSNVLGSDNQWGYRLSASYMDWNGPENSPVDTRKGFFAINPVITFHTKNGFSFWVWTGFVSDQSPRLNRIGHGFETGVGGGLSGGGQIDAALADQGGAQNVLANYAKVDTESYEAGMTKTITFGNLRIDTRFLTRFIDELNSTTLVNATGGLDVYVNKAGAIIGTDGRTIPYSEVAGNVGGVYRSVGVQLTGTNDYYKTQTYAGDFAFSFDTGPITNKLLVFGEADSLDTSLFPGYAGKVYLASTLTALAKLNVPIVGTTAEIWEYPISRDNLAGVNPSAVINAANSVSVSANTAQNSDEYSGGAVERASFLDQRIFLVAGLRYTDFPTASTTGTAAPIDTSDVSWQGSYGGLIKLYKGTLGEASFFYNNNRTFIPVFTIDKRLATYGQKLPDNSVAMQEEGIKFDLLGSRLVATASIWRTHESDVLIPETDVTGAITGISGGGYSVPGGVEALNGWDMDLDASLMRGLDVIFSAGENTTSLNSQGGIRTSGDPTNTIAALARYEIPAGPLKNLSLAWNFTYWGASMLNSRTFWMLPPGYNHDAILGYHWKRFTLRLRVDDVFNHVALLPSLNETAVGLTDHRNYRTSLDYRW